MLQTRFENEQFDSLPLVFANNRSRTDYITTDRPDSSQLVDLHIYLIPKTVWKNVQHLAQNEAMNDAISAGFVRVSPEMKLRDLRESIEMLCGKENDFPREFLFLRSVGRCLTRVKSTQENELKVKNYRPPQILASEIYLLEGRHEDYGNISSASPALSSASYVFGNRHQHRFNLDEYNQQASRLSQLKHRRSLRTEKEDLPMLNTNQVTYRRSSSKKKSGSRLTQLDLDESSPNISVVTGITSRELIKLKEEQERLRRRQEELERMRRAAEEKKLHFEREENERQRRREEKEQEEKERQRRREEKEHEEKERQRRREEKEQSEREEKERQRRREEKEQEEKERQRRRDEKEQSEREEKERQRRREEKEKTERDEEERRRRQQQRRQEKIEVEHRRVEKLELAATKIQASFRGYQDRQVFRHRQKSLMKNRSRKSSTIQSEKKSDINDDELSDGTRIVSRTSVESTTDFDSNPSRPETRTMKKVFRESISSNSSSLISIKPEKKFRSKIPLVHSKTEDLSMKDNLDHDKNVRSATVTKIRHTDDEETLHVSTPDTKDDDTYEFKRREADAKRHRHLEDEKRKSKELEEQRRRELTKLKQREDAESLRARLEELRADRVRLDKVRDEVIKQLKNMHQRITSRRKDARDMWKKKYFQEKKKTPSIEDRVSQLKNDLEFLHSKITQTIDSESKHSAQVGCLTEAETGNLILQITRTQYEMQNIRHQLDRTKLRLTTDIKLRNQADNECQLLKHELNEAKMNLNQIKYLQRV